MTLIDDTARQRLAAAADRVEETRTAYDLAVKQRDRAVSEAVDVAGIPQSIVARLVRVSAPQVNRILAKVAGLVDGGPVVPV